MRKILYFILVPIIVLAFGGWLLFQIFVGDVKDRVSSMEIPKYPKATNWKVLSGCGVPGEGSCSTDIYFHSDDNKDTVFNYYKIEFKKRNILYESEGKLYGTGNPSYTGGGWISFRKGVTTYYLSTRSNDSAAIPGTNYYFTIKNNNK